MRKLFPILVALLILGSVATASAQIPNVEVHFKGVGEAVEECPGFGIIDTIFVVVNNFSMWMSAIEYKIEYPPEMIFLGENTGGLNIGSSPIGISTAWAFPLNAYGSLIVNTVTFMWNCMGCPRTDIPVVVVGHPLFPPWPPRAIRWPDEAIITGVGCTSLICPTVPVEDTSWGQIKELYK